MNSFDRPSTAAKPPGGQLGLSLLWVAAVVLVSPQTAVADAIAFAGDSTETIAASSEIPLQQVQEHFLGDVAEKVGRRTNPRGSVRSLLYPMGNADVSTAFAAFDGPQGGLERVTIVDALPFGTPAEIRARHDDTQLQRHYFGSVRAAGHADYVSTIHFQDSVALTGAAMFWELESMGARDISVQYLTQDGRRRKPPTRARLRGISKANRAEGGLEHFSPPPLKNYDPNHRDIVEVSFRLGDRRASVLYVQHDLDDLEGTPQVLRDVLTRGYDAYLEKAPFGPIKRFRELALNGLNRGGVAVGEYLDADTGLPLRDGTQLPRKLGHGGKMAMLWRADRVKQNRRRFSALWPRQTRERKSSRSVDAARARKRNNPLVEQRNAVERSPSRPRATSGGGLRRKSQRGGVRTRLRGAR